MSVLSAVRCGNMKPYGVKRKDKGCCPGHDKYSCEGSMNKARLRPAKKSIRQKTKLSLKTRDE